ITAKEQLKLQTLMVNQLNWMFKYAQNQHKLGATSPMLEEVIRQHLEVQKGKIAMIKNDIVHFQNTLIILMGRNPGKIVT
ncbi:TolC family protein, partial [Francisella tularensis subsp. holarctica]|nr:TolC family protein [Francisella tularensis subsp. holarctica]